MNFENIPHCAGALKLDARVIHAARRLGCMAFVHGRVRGSALIEYLAANLRAVNQEAVAGGWYGKHPDTLTGPIVERLRRTLAELEAQAAPEKRHRGREIAAAVRRELTDELATRLAGMAPEAVSVELRAIRERILAA